MPLDADAHENLAERVARLESELDRLRRTFVALALEVHSRAIDEVITDFADRPLNEAEMEEAFAKLDAVRDAAYRAHVEEDRPRAPIEDPVALKRLLG